MKRLLDIFISLLVVLLFLPIFIILCLLVWFKIGWPIFFFQQRPGLAGKPFMMVKFRTMTDRRDNSGNLLSDANRLTSLGRFLRSSSMDELPEIWNVLKGDMSLVGPRPLLMEYLPLYSKDQSRRHDVKPGITGWAQINGRNAISWEEKFKLDVWYVDNQTLLLDLKILMLTVFKVVKRQGVSAESHATMPRFTGSDQDTER